MAAVRKASLRLAALAAAALAVLGPTSAQAGSRPVAGSAVTGLHAFLYTSNDPSQTTFPRTPAFAWNPVAGAAHYEFQLSTSNTFRDSGIIFEDDQVPGPAEAVNVPLPWITGSLYARVRAVLPKTLTPWSQGWAFTVRWTCASDPNKPCYPTPLDSSQPQYPGLIQWTPIDGATAYEVWYIDADAKFFTTLTSADEREYYTLHQDAKWTGTVRWRVRALRDISYGGTLNGLPTRSYGPWSPVYSSTNPAFAGGPITLNGTVTNGVFENGTGPAHPSMPAFVFSGNQGTDGASYELYRVNIYSDKDCLNRVFQGAMVGSPAYAPRSYDAPVSEAAPFQDPSQYPPTLAFPGDSGALALARNGYLPHGSEGGLRTYDNLILPPATEATSGSAPDLATSNPAASSGSGSGDSSGSGSGSSSDAGSSSSGSSSSGSSSSSGASKTAYVPGAPIDIWDTDWPAGGYYWTVIPIRTTSKGAMATTVAAFASAGSTALFLQDASRATAGTQIQIGSGATAENLSIASVSGSGITLSAPLAHLHAPGEPVVSLGSAEIYQEAELPSETCTNFQRVQPFGKTSAPPQVTAASVPYVSGLSATGVKLLPAAQHKPTVYGVPLVSWAPIASAGAYEVEWSKKAYPFKLEANNPSVVTYATSLLLGPRRSDGSVGPLSPGVWYYRVRGIDFSLAAGSSPASRRLSWSDPIPILVAKPTFKIVGGGTSVTVGKSSGSSASSWHRWALTGFALTLPKAWKQLSVKDTVISFAAYDPALKGGYRTSVSVLAAGGRDTRTVAEWEQDLVAQAKRLTTGTVVHSVVTEPGGTAVYLEYHVPSGKKTVAVQQYVFDAGTKSYIVTFTTLAGLEQGYSATFAAAARSFRLG